MSMLINPYWFQKSSFVPTDYLTFNNLYWVEGEQFQALGLADSAAVATWPDEMSVVDATQATAGSRPTYLVSSPITNDRPSLYFNSDSVYASLGSSLGQSATVIAIVYWQDTTTPGYVFDGTSGARCLMGTNYGGTSWQIYAGGSQTGSRSASGLTMMTGVFNGANSVLEHNGAAVTGVGSIGGNVIQDWHIGGNVTNKMQNTHIPFFAVVDGDARTQPAWSDFETDLMAFYNIA